MTATFTADVFCSLDGFGSATGTAWGGYWDKQGPELLGHRLKAYSRNLRLVLGAKTYRAFADMHATDDKTSDVFDLWVDRMLSLPTTVISRTLSAPLLWPNATIEAADAIDAVARLKLESDVPLRSHGSLSMVRSLMGAGLVDQLVVTIFPAITGETGAEPLFAGARDFDLELIEARTLDGRTQ